MKKILTLMLLAPLAAIAQVLYMPNEAGGEIVLTSRACKVNGKVVKNIYEAYAWSPNSDVITGCWNVIDGNVHVQYGQNHRVYRIEHFKVRD
jgi:hypothetical protein